MPNRTESKMIVRSDQQLSPVAKATVLAHSMETVAHGLDELSRLSTRLGYEALGTEAKVIQETFVQRRKAMLSIAEQAAKP